MKLPYALCLAVVALAFFSSGGDAVACTVCYNPNEGTSINGALNGMIFVMLGFVGVVWVGFGYFFYYLMSRAKTPTPDHILLAESINPDDLDS